MAQRDSMALSCAEYIYSCRATVVTVRHWKSTNITACEGVECQSRIVRDSDTSLLRLMMSGRSLSAVIAHGGSKVGNVVSAKIEGKGNIEFVYARDPEGNIVELQKWG